MKSERKSNSLCKSVVVGSEYFLDAASMPKVNSDAAIYSSFISKKSSKPVIVSRVESCRRRNSKNNCKKLPQNALVAKRPTKPWAATADRKVFLFRSLSHRTARKGMRR